MDEAVQRVVEVLLSIPQLPLWMGLSAALPLSWPVVRMYFAIAVILSLVGWTRLAREVRGRFLSLRQEDYVVAAQARRRRPLRPDLISNGAPTRRRAHSADVPVRS